MMGGKRVADLSARLFGMVSAALGGLILLIGTIMINSTIDMRSMIFEMHGALPHFESRISRLERLHEQKR